MLFTVTYPTGVWEDVLNTAEGEWQQIITSILRPMTARCPLPMFSAVVTYPAMIWLSEGNPYTDMGLIASGGVN